jgi:predicted permease
MTHLHILISRFVSLFRRAKLDRELEDEIQNHLEMDVEAKVRAGMTHTEARQAALRHFGGTDRTKERYRDLLGLRFVETLFQDVRYSLRALLRSPGFTLTAVASIAIAIGANSAIFSVADGILLRPLPVPNPSGVLTLSLTSPAANEWTAGLMSYPEYEDYRKNLRSFEGLLAYDDVGLGLALDAEDQADLRMGYIVSGNFFQLLGVEPVIGRTFRPEDDLVPGRDAVVVLGHDLWTKRFGADPGVLGRTVRLNSLPFTVIGVVPASFTGINQFLVPEVFVPIAMSPALAGESAQGGGLTSREARGFEVRGRLKPGVSIRAARTEASVFASILQQTYPASNTGIGATVATEVQTRMSRFPGLGTFVVSMFVIVTVILLIASANVANLMLARGRSRQREVAVRLAVGASRLRLVRLLLVESLIVAVCGGALAWFTAGFALTALESMQAPASGGQTFYLPIQLDTRVLWFTVLVSVTSAFVFGLVPALQSARTDLVSSLRTGQSSSGRRGFSARTALVVAQIAGAVFLLISATQFRSAFEDALAANPGFRRDHRITMRFQPGLTGYTPAQTRQFFDQLVERALQVPGIKAAALTSRVPMTYMDMGGHRVIPEGYTLPPGVRDVEVLSYIVDHHYFDTLQVPVIAGRGFRESDRSDSRPVAIVNEAFARQYLGSKPLGKRLWVNGPDSPPVEVVGVTVTGKSLSVIEPTMLAIYLPFSQVPTGRMTLVAETFGNPSAMAEPLLAMVRSLDPGIAVFWIQTMDQIFESSLVGVLRAVQLIFDAASVLGLVLALVGLYAVVSYQVAQQTREIGIRMALGAERLQVLKTFLARAAIHAVLGIGIGLGLSFVANRSLAQGLGLPPFNRALLAFALVGMFLTGLLAAAVPARRASQVDPQRALRQE